LILKRAPIGWNQDDYDVLEDGVIVGPHFKVPIAPKGSTVDFERIVSKRKGSPYRSGRSPDWLKMKNPDAPAVKREAEEDWGH
jgi:hypothetical protein